MITESHTPTYLHTPWNTVLLEELTGSLLVRKFPHILWNPKILLPHVQMPATCPYPEPDRSRPHTFCNLEFLSIKFIIKFNGRVACGADSVGIMKPN